MKLRVINIQPSVEVNHDGWFTCQINLKFHVQGKDIDPMELIDRVQKVLDKIGTELNKEGL